MKKKVILAIGVAMSALLVGGCGTAKNDVTAEGLLSKANSVEYKAGGYDLAFDTELSIDMGEATTDEDAEKTTDSITEDISSDSSSMSMTMGMGLTGEILCGTNENISMNGEMKMNMLGMEENSPIKIYLQKDENNYIAYTSSGEDSKYTKEIFEDFASNIPKMDASIFTELSLDSSGDDYKVTGKLNIKKINNDSTERFKKLLKIEDDIDNFNFNIEWIFDKKTEDMKQLTITCDENNDTIQIDAGIISGGLKFKTFTITLTSKEFSENIEIPQEVIEKSTAALS